MKEILSSLESLFLQFNTRRLLFWIFMLILAVVAGLAFESFTGYVFFGNMEKKVALLKELNALAQSGIDKNSDLAPIYKEAVNELSSHKVETLSVFSISQYVTVEDFGKFMSGILLFLVVAIVAVQGRNKNGDSWKAGLYGAILFGLIAGFAGVWIPTIYNPWVNYIGFPILQFALIWLLTKVTNTSKAAKKPRTT